MHSGLLWGYKLWAAQSEVEVFSQALYSGGYDFSMELLREETKQVTSPRKFFPIVIFFVWYVRFIRMRTLDQARSSTTITFSI